MKTNYHTHTSLCKHAQGEVCDYVEQAVIKKMDVLGMSDHAPFPDNAFTHRMDFEMLNFYFNEIDEAKKLFSDVIDIKKGLEIEYIKRYDDIGYYKELYDKYKVDYLILGQHCFESLRGDIKNIYSLDKPELVIDYALSVRDAMETGYFQIVAHPDIFAFNMFKWDRYFDEASRIIIEAACDNNVVLEFNCGQFRSGSVEYPDGIRLPYPHYKFWEMVSKTNAKVIIGSDAHKPKDLYDEHVLNAKFILADLGIHPIETI